MGYDDSHTLARYLETGGYEGLRTALAKAPDDVTEEVKTSTSPVGAARASPPARSGRSCPRTSIPRYVVINGDESEPGTFKDRQLIERDPHQLIEGTLICAYAVAGGARVHLRAGRDGAGAGARCQRAERGLRPRCHRPQRVRFGLEHRRGVPLGRRRLHRGRGDRAAREPRGQAGVPADQAAVLPGGQGPLLPADDRQQRRDGVATSRGSCRTAGPHSPRSAATAPPAPACSACPAMCRSRATTRSRW